MEYKTINYFTLILAHAGIALLVFIFPFFSKVYALLILFAGIIFIVKKQNRNNEVLLAAAYLCGAEVFLRATGGVPVYEFCKYGVMIIIGFGMFYSGFSKNAIPYWIYLLLLIPSVIIATFVLSSSIEDRKVISFVISGPACLGFCALYTYQRKVTYKQINDILLAAALPVVTMTIYLILYNPSVRDVVTGTDSNPQTSGGFGPNQVSTALGLGIFIFVSRAVLQSKSIGLVALNMIIALCITFRGLVTFSRGGILTSVVMIAALVIGLYFKFNYKARVKLNYMIVAIVGGGMLIWGYSIFQTNGLIAYRYSNKDAAGKVKESRFTGREEIARTELDAFYESPVLGVGAGKTIDMREAVTGVNTASHNEITRLLAEHGALGILALIILFATPIILHLDNRENFFMFPLLFFWFLTINHAAMRIAAPAFIYSLSLLKIYISPPPQKTSP